MSATIIRRRRSPDLTEPLSLRLLRARLKRIDELLDELPKVDLGRHQRDHHNNILHITERERVALTVADQLETLRRVTSVAIEEATAKIDLDQQRQLDAELDFVEQEQRSVAAAQLTRFAEQNDWPQWSKRYVAAAFLRERCAAEMGLAPMPAIFR